MSIVFLPGPMLFGLFLCFNLWPIALQAGTTDASSSHSAAASLSGRPVCGETWVNGLGMVFKPVAGTKVLFSQYDTRVKDYQAFIEATKKKAPRDWAPTPFPQTGDHPAVQINWADAVAFCQWLTQKDRAAGRLSGDQKYRLPTDKEWSLAAGGKKYPWGNAWPPVRGFGNYAESYTHDGFVSTSPVGSFPPNQFGLYDMGGNVWQWCQERANVGLFSGKLEGWRVLRGGSWLDDGTDSLKLDCRRYENASPNQYVLHIPLVLTPHYGFRCVVVY